MNTTIKITIKIIIWGSLAIVLGMFFGGLFEGYYGLR